MTTTVLDRPVEAPERTAPRVSMPDEASARLLEAADLLEAEGFIQEHWAITPEIKTRWIERGAYDKEEPLACGRCTVGGVLRLDDNHSVYTTYDNDPIGRRALKKLANYLGLDPLVFSGPDNDVPGKYSVLFVVSHWSERKGRTIEEVATALRRAALSAEATTF